MPAVSSFHSKSCQIRVRLIHPFVLKSSSKNSDSISPTSSENITSKPLWNLPNILSAGRVLMIPLVLVSWPYPRIRTGLFIAAAVTDWFDGFLARKLNQSSRFGAFLDPVADKLLVTFLLVMLSGERGLSVAIPAGAILCREIGISALREWMAESGERDVVAVSKIGKVKTALQLVSLAVLLSEVPTTRSASHSQRMGLLLLYLAASATWISGLDYFRAAWPVLARPEVSSSAR